MDLKFLKWLRTTATPKTPKTRKYFIPPLKEISLPHIGRHALIQTVELSLSQKLTSTVFLIAAFGVQPISGKENEWCSWIGCFFQTILCDIKYCAYIQLPKHLDWIDVFYFRDYETDWFLIVKNVEYPNMRCQISQYKLLIMSLIKDLIYIRGLSY